MSSGVVESTDCVNLAPRQQREPSVLDAAALLLETLDDLVVRGARDTHRAVAARVRGLAGRATFGASGPPSATHDLIAAGVYGAIGLTLRTVLAAWLRWQPPASGRPSTRRGPVGTSEPPSTG